MQNKTTLNETEKLDLADVTEYARYSMEIEHTFTELQKGLAVCYDPKEIVLNVMRVATEFYDADWCGIFEVDIELGIFSPFWWYNRELGAMSRTLLKEIEALEYSRWTESLKNHTAMIIGNVEDVRKKYPEEYELYARLQVKNLMAVPFWKGLVGFLVLRNPKRYTKQTSFLRMLNYIVVNSLSEYFMIETSKLTLTSPRITNDKDVYISLFGEMKIVGPKGILTESELKSPKIARLLVYLLMSKKNGVSPREMANAIWPDEDCDSVTKNFKGLVYRLQQAFSLISDCRLVTSTPNGYRLNPELNITTDYQLFQMKRANAFAANSIEQKIDLLRKASDLYAGPFFHSASNEHWIMATSVDYYYQYVSLMGELLKTLFDEKDFICVHKYAATALQFAPHSEDFCFWMIRSTMRIGHTEAARGELRMAQTNLLEEEYAVLIERLKEVGELP